MIKTLFSTAALLVSVVAYAANPNAPFSDQVVPATSAPPTIPAGAAAVGFTALAYNYDFTSAAYGTLSNWLDCAGATKPQWWVEPYSTAGKAPCSAFSIINDGGTNALDIHWDPSYFNGGNVRAAELESAPNSGYSYPTGFFFPPNAYIEIKEKVTTASLNACNGAFCQLGDVFTWTTPTMVPNALEWDVVEQGTDGGWQGGGGPNYSGGASRDPGHPSQYHYPGTDSYHIYAVMQNIDSAGNLYRCDWLDNQLMHCTGNAGNVNPPGATQDLRQGRNWIKMGTGPTNSSTNFNNPADTIIEWIHVFSCPQWATTQCFSTGLPQQ